MKLALTFLLGLQATTYAMQAPGMGTFNEPSYEPNNVGIPARSTAAVAGKLLSLSSLFIGYSDPIKYYNKQTYTVHTAHTVFPFHLFALSERSFGSTSEAKDSTIAISFSAACWPHTLHRSYGDQHEIPAVLGARPASLSVPNGE